MKFRLNCARNEEQAGDESHTEGIHIHEKLTLLSQSGNRRCLASVIQVKQRIIALDCRTHHAMKIPNFALLFCLLISAGCGGSSNNSSNTSTGNTGLGGNWQMTLQHKSQTESQSGFLLETGTILSGNLMFSGQTISGQTVCSGVGSVQGQSNNGSITITVLQAAQTANLTGTASTDQSSMNGSYSIFASGCGKSETGTWTATRVIPLTGTFSAMFSSTRSANVTFSANGSLTQGANKGNSYAYLAGTMSSTNAACFTSASFTGVISGTAVLLNISDSSGPLGSYSGTAATDASEISGTYKFSNAQSSGGCSDAGQAVFTVNPSSG
jgi:hypothetical protein